MGLPRRALVVGNFCHDVLIRDDVVIAESLGGAASFISNIFSHLSINSQYISKIGPDFKYSAFNFIPSNPIISPTSKTTLFHAHFTSMDPTPSGPPVSDRALKRVTACDPIWPDDVARLGAHRFDFGMAVGVGGEILCETLEKMFEICDVVVVDIQGLIREFDENDGIVRLVKLKDSKFYDLLPKIGFLKASGEEAEYMDVDEVRKLCCVVVTYGENGCKLYWKDGEVEISPFRALQVDPTGAGDSLLGGFVAGLAYGLSLPDAALLGNFFGSLTVSQIGLPKFDQELMMKVKDEVQRRALHSTAQHFGIGNELWFTRSHTHELFYESLSALRQASALAEQECQEERNLRCLNNHVPIAANLNNSHEFCRQKLLHDSGFNEPIESPEGTP